MKIVEKEVDRPGALRHRSGAGARGGAKADQGTAVTITVGKKVGGGGGNGRTTGNAADAQRR